MPRISTAAVALDAFTDIRQRDKIFIAVQPVKVEMTQDNYTTVQNIK